MPDGVQIDTAGVDGVARKIRDYGESGFADVAARGQDLHGHGVVFGQSVVAGPIQEAKERYRTALENTEANLSAYQRAATILADVAEQIARDFTRADLSSAAAQKQVQELMNGAIIRANKQFEETETLLERKPGLL